MNADFTGKVLELRTAEGRVLEPGDEVVTLAPVSPASGRPAPTSSSRRTRRPASRPGCTWTWTCPPRRRRRYGVVHAEISSVSGAPISPQEMDVLLSNDGLVEQFSEDGPPILATVELEKADNPSGLNWSTGDGPDFPLVPGTIVDGRRASRASRRCST